MPEKNHDNIHDKHKIRELEQELEIKTEILNALEEENKESKAYSTDHDQRELEQENKMLLELFQTLEEKSSSEIEQFFSMISHELKTPLVPIQGYVKLLKDGQFGNLEEIQKAKLGIIDSNTTALSSLIQNMLDFQKLSSGTMEMKKEQTKVKKVIDDSLFLLDSEITEKEIEIKISADENVELTCDAKRISQVLTNLLKNSLVAISQKSGKIKINANQISDVVQVSVIDNGCGIPKEDVDKVFSKFYQVDMSNTREKPGVGLGLSICKKIIEAHNGKIWIESELEKGTGVNFTLPINQKHI
jgi:signal transduction histidine kinase